MSPLTAARAFLGSSLLALATLSFATPEPLSAQGSVQSTSIEFLSGGPSREGYEYARVSLRYRFLDCGGTLELHLAPAGGGVNASGTYWAGGQSGEPAEAANPPRFPSFNAPAQVLSGTQVIARTRVFGPSADVPLGCFTGYDVDVGAMATFLLAGATEAQRNQFLASLRLEVTGPADRTLISDASRNAMQRAAREEAREQEREEAERRAQARSDSVARARAAAQQSAAARPSSGGTDSATAAGTNATGQAVQSSATTDRQRAAADSAERVRRVMAAIEAQRLAEEREQELIRQTGEAAGAAVAGLITAIADAREAAEERRLREAAAAARRRASALVAYEARTVHRRCDYRTDARPLPEDGNISGTVTADDCEGADRGNRDVYRVTLRAKQSIVVDVFESSVESFVVAISRMGTNGPVGLASTAGDDLEFQAPTAGTYYVAIGNLHPGFTGSYRINARALSSTSVGWYIGVGGLVGGSDIGTSGYQTPFEFDARVGYSLTPQITPFAKIQGSSGIPGVEVGLRYLALTQQQRTRPWVEATYGSRVVSFDDGYTILAEFKGSGYAVGAGISHYFWAIGSVDVGVHYASATVDDGSGGTHALSGARAVIGFSVFNRWKQ